MTWPTRSSDSAALAGGAVVRLLEDISDKAIRRKIEIIRNGWLMPTDFVRCKFINKLYICEFGLLSFMYSESVFYG